ncbi:hypothetical protein QE109_11175 [Fusibacter bizertensis]|uniref:Uncharacterized protein n=1 Tax=Fusibacter bizertensis TaxID=1488331 RepID=A0ABT6NE60_9FIRM|nr:hypothetical protein [Fusibacter bizertensis]MDH8678714.1 hypothetical protein [Fusibacter bizertensis]
MEIIARLINFDMLSSGRTDTLWLESWFPVIAVMMVLGFMGILIYTIVKTNISLKRMDQIEEEVKAEIKSLRELNK